VHNTKGPVKAAAPIIQPAATQSAAGPSRPETPQKRRHVPSFTAPGPTCHQVLISFGKGLAPNLDVARLHNAVNQALTTAHAKVAVLSLGPAYDGYSLTTSQVANVKDLEIIRGAVAPLLPTGLQYWVFFFFFKKNQKFILQCSITVRMPDTQRYKALLPMSRCY